MSDGERLVIEHEDLLPTEPQAPPLPPSNIPAAPRVLPSIQGVRPPAKPVTLGGPGINFGSTFVSNTLGSAVAALAGWAIFRMFFGHDYNFTNLVVHTAEEIAVFGAVFGAVCAAWDDTVSRVWEAAGQSALIGAALGAVCGAASGALAQVIFTHFLDQAFQNGESLEGPGFYLARGLAWAVFGGGVGIALGIANRSSRKALNAAIGGVIGGALGGIVFQYVGFHIESESLSQLVGFGVVGLGIGVAVGLVEIARRQAWLQVIAGGMTGKEFIVYHAATHIGSAPKCEITLIKDPEVAPYHCRIDDHDGRYAISAFEGCQMRINGAPATGQWLRSGDSIEVGRSTLRYSERHISP